MYHRLGEIVTRHWVLVILTWFGLVVLVKLAAPSWDDVTFDGDLAYLPDSMSSVRAERLLEEYFPNGRSKSTVVLAMARSPGPLTADDMEFGDRAAARLLNLHAVSAYRRSDRLYAEAARMREQDGSAADGLFAEATRWQDQARRSWDEAIRLDDRFAAARCNRAQYLQTLGSADEAQIDWQLATDFEPELVQSVQRDGKWVPDVGELPILDVWTHQTDVVGQRLRSKDKCSQLVLVRLSQEFMAVDNIRVLQEIEGVLADLRSQATPQGLEVGLSGSAAVGGDMLRSAAASIRNTERYTIVLVVAILLLVYRSPVLLAIPLVTIVTSLMVATGLVAALTQLDAVPGFQWWNFKVFTTTKIFVVVILYGAGTDFCLFLISRYREGVQGGGQRKRAAADAVSGVGEALAASALTTIVGLSMMAFADFGKFRNSGPAIGFCLAITLLACLTLAPALLCGLGAAVVRPLQKSRSLNAPARGIWGTLARALIAYPGRILVVSLLVLLPLALIGTHVQVTYDFLSELDPSEPSRQGTELMRDHYPIGESGPLILLARTSGCDIDTREGRLALTALTRSLYVDGVQSVRSLSEPLGDPPRRNSILRPSKIGYQTHEFSRALFLNKPTDQSGDVLRFQLVLNHDPFSVEAIDVLQGLDVQLARESSAPSSFWSGTEFVFGGTTAAIRDLRRVTSSDNLRIQILVVLAVFSVLLCILRRPAVCMYLIASVLLSYYVTIGITELVFRSLYGSTFSGLDWKVPIFLFVILVAIGQDYNIYLVTRVLEEQERWGRFAGLRRAIERTGGIITSCGVIMAGTFVSMTTGSLRGVTELGFALSLGVMIDTFLVRTILVPAFLALFARWRTSAPSIRPWMRPPHSLSRASLRPPRTDRQTV